jgi:predicted DNA-binding protein (UPF0251 family)
MTQELQNPNCCRTCGNSGELVSADNAHGNHSATCSSCGRPVTPAHEENDRSPFWFVGGEGSPSFQQTRSPDVTAAQWLAVLIDIDEWLKPGKVASAQEAALALCGCNPLVHDRARARPVVDGPMAGQYERMLAHFEKVEQSDLRVHRTLRDWWALAVPGGFERHPHIDDLLRTPAVSQQHGLVASVADATAHAAAPAELPCQMPKRGKWSREQLHTLWLENIQVGMTQERLAQKYGVSRQRISARLKQAQDLFGKAKASPFPTVANTGRRGRKAS